MWRPPLFCLTFVSVSHLRLAFFTSVQLIHNKLIVSGWMGFSMITWFHHHQLASAQQLENVLHLKAYNHIISERTQIGQPFWKYWIAMLEWMEEGDRMSFDDSDRFEEDSLCSWGSEPESLCNNWRGWKKPLISSTAHSTPLLASNQRRAEGEFLYFCLT